MIRITAHSSDPAFLVLRIDQAHNRVVGTFEPARRQDDMGIGIYVMEASKLDSLKAWARFQNIHLLNEVRDKAEPTKPLECGNQVTLTDKRTGETYTENCAAPYPAGRIPRYCAACGQSANPVAYGADSPDIGVKCDCGQVSLGGPKFCPACGAQLPERHLHAPAIRRTKSEPQPIGKSIADFQRRLAVDAGPVVAELKGHLG